MAQSEGHETAPQLVSEPAHPTGSPPAKVPFEVGGLLTSGHRAFAKQPLSNIPQKAGAQAVGPSGDVSSGASGCRAEAAPRATIDDPKLPAVFRMWARFAKSRDSPRDSAGTSPVDGVAHQSMCLYSSAAILAMRSCRSCKCEQDVCVALGRSCG